MFVRSNNMSIDAKRDLLCQKENDALSVSSDLNSHAHTATVRRNMPVNLPSTFTFETNTMEAARLKDRT